jgi:molybdopterin/thiamine biosynthesis adenylyltransferase
LSSLEQFATRLVVSDSCTALRIPLVSAAIGMFQVQIGTWRGWEPDRPCYRCFVGDAFDAEDCDTCADDGMLGAMAGWAGSFAALQAVKVLLAGVSALGDPGWGRLHIFDGLEPGMRTIRIAKDAGCKGCGHIV